MSNACADMLGYHQLMADIRSISDDSKALREALAGVRILYTDLDGTLLARGGCLLADADGTPSTKVAEAVVALNRAGLTVVPVSGRGRAQLSEFVRILGWDSFIAEAGAILQRGVGASAEITYNNAGWPASLLVDATPFEVIKASGAYERLCEAFPGRFEYHDPWHLGREATHIMRGCVSAEEAQRVIDDIEPPITVLDNGIVRNAGTLRCDGEPPHAYHLVPRGVSKAQAIRLDLIERGLEPSQAAAIGDSATDVEMADAVGVMALVANAFESAGVLSAIKGCARDNVWRTDSERGEGWAEFAHEWLEASQ
jgi:HAD superfamily hydrolase (TIGR01484 family)